MRDREASCAAVHGVTKVGHDLAPKQQQLEFTRSLLLLTSTKLCLTLLHPMDRKIPGEGNGNPLQYACLENSMDGGAWQATVRGVTKSRTGRSN